MFLHTVYTVLGLNPGRQEYNVSPIPEQDVFRIRAVLVHRLMAGPVLHPCGAWEVSCLPFPRNSGGDGAVAATVSQESPEQSQSIATQHFCLVCSVLGKNSTAGMSLSRKRLLPHKTIDVHMRNIFISLLP